MRGNEDTEDDYYDGLETQWHSVQYAQIVADEAYDSYRQEQIDNEPDDTYR